MADELEVVEVEGAVVGEAGGGRDRRPVWVGAPMGLLADVGPVPGDAGGGVAAAGAEGGGGGGG